MSQYAESITEPGITSIIRDIGIKVEFGGI